MKKRRGKLLIILVVVLVVLVGALVGVNALNAYNEKKAEEEEAAEEEAEKEASSIEITTFRLMDGVETESVCQVDWNYDGQDYEIRRTDDGWECDEGIPLDTDYCNGVARAVAYTRAATEVDMTGRELSEFGLDDPVMDITYTLDDGTSYTIHLGTRNAVLDQNYATVDGIDGVYLLSSNLWNSVGKRLLDLAVTDIMPTMDNIQEISLSGDVNLSFVCPENYEDYSYTSAYTNYLLDENGEYIEIDSDSTYYATNTLTEDEFNWHMTVDYCPNGEGLEKYGLDDPRLKVHIWYSTDQEDEDGNYTESIDGEITLCYGDDAGEGLIYCQPEGSDFVYSIDSTESDYLLALNVDDMLTKYVWLMEWDSIEEMDISVSDGTSTQFMIERDSEGNATDYLIDGHSVDREEMRQLYYQIFSMSQDARVYDSSLSTDDAYVTVTCTRDRDDEYKTMTMYLIPYSTDFYIADFNGMQEQLINKRTIDSFVSDLEAELESLGE